MIIIHIKVLSIIIILFLNLFYATYSPEPLPVTHKKTADTQSVVCLDVTGQQTNLIPHIQMKVNHSNMH